MRVILSSPSSYSPHPWPLPKVGEGKREGNNDPNAKTICDKHLYFIAAL